jgi:hypothetical protein
VQIFTVPTLTPRLVRDQGLLDVLLGTARKLLLPTVGLDGRIEVSAIEDVTCVDGVSLCFLCFTGVWNCPCMADLMVCS